MTHLSDLFPLADLDAALNDHLVVRRKLTDAPVFIYNYTERCQYEKGLWNAVTTQCRGIIADDHGELLARPFRKFFNYGQAEAPTMDLTAPVITTDKLDGSLGILYTLNGRVRVATRGSLDSEQAIHATGLLRERYSDYVPPDGWTVCVEIIYPDNRIVLDYGPLDDLVLLGAVEIATGRTVGPTDAVLDGWPGLRALVFPYRTLAEALAAPPRPNAEGLVVHFVDSDERVKLKQEDYVALHRIITGLNERSVWEHVAAGKPLVDLLAVIPDEFHEWVGSVAAELAMRHTALVDAVEQAYLDIIGALPAGYTRKDFALLAARHPERGTLFMRHDGKDYTGSLWDAVRPGPNRGPRVLTPDAA